MNEFIHSRSSVAPNSEHPVGSTENPIHMFEEGEVIEPVQGLGDSDNIDCSLWANVIFELGSLGANDSCSLLVPVATTLLQNPAS